MLTGAAARPYRSIPDRFGATEIGFIAASIATCYYRSGLATVQAWTLGASIVAGAIRVTLLRRRLKD